MAKARSPQSNFEIPTPVPSVLCLILVGFLAGVLMSVEGWLALKATPLFLANKCLLVSPTDDANMKKITGLVSKIIEKVKNKKTLTPCILEIKLLDKISYTLFVISQNSSMSTNVSTYKYFYINISRVYWWIEVIVVNITATFIVLFWTLFSPSSNPKIFLDVAKVDIQTDFYHLRITSFNIFLDNLSDTLYLCYQKFICIILYVIQFRGANFLFMFYSGMDNQNIYIVNKTISTLAPNVTNLR